MSSLEQLAYPIGRFAYDEAEAVRDHLTLLRKLIDFPGKLHQFLEGVHPAALESTYRPEGWNARQVIHHLFDSHTHAYMRFKWALTEENPSILPYDEQKFALLSDYSIPVEVALNGLDVVHRKWGVILENMEESDWKKTYFHTGYSKSFELRYALSMYVWHSSHHFEHIRLCLKP
ncbi:MAG: putative metal-dependent hydrolase [Saprospiraceae bacterium]|jgi:hypothetical protein|nr:putative metal-dependent hydrolase [Saprospiraceae bacterium]